MFIFSSIDIGFFQHCLLKRLLIFLPLNTSFFRCMIHIKFIQSISRPSDLLFGFVSLILIKDDIFSLKICCDGQNGQVLRVLV